MAIPKTRSPPHPLVTGHSHPLRPLHTLYARSCRISGARFSLMQSSPRPGAASTSTSGSGQRRPQGNQPCRTLLRLLRSTSPCITLSDWEGQGERAHCRRYGGVACSHGQLATPRRSGHRARRCIATGGGQRTGSCMSGRREAGAVRILAGHDLEDPAGPVAASARWGHVTLPLRSPSGAGWRCHREPQHRRHQHPEEGERP
jgi:hypothetical protein